MMEYNISVVYAVPVEQHKRMITWLRQHCGDGYAWSLEFHTEFDASDTDDLLIEYQFVDPAIAILFKLTF